MTRTLFLGLALVLILFALWQFSQGGDIGGDIGGMAATDPPAPAEEPGERELARPITLEGAEDAAAARISAEELTTVFEGPSARTTSNARIWFIGRVVDSAGTPLGERTLPSRLQVHRGMFGPTHFESEVETDADGRFRQDVDGAWLEQGTPMTVEVFDASEPSPRAARATFVSPSHLDDGEHDLGEARVRGPVVLARGRTVDRRGGAVAQARVSLRWAQRVTVPPGADPARYLRDSWWMLDDVHARSGETGAFELVGFAPDAPLRVEAKKEGHLDAPPVECELGAKDLEVLLATGGDIAGRVLFDQGIPLDRFQIEVQVGEGMPGFRRLPLQEDGAFQAEGLPPGPGRVSLVLRPDRDKLVEIDDVHAAPSGANRDSRLDPLDMRGALTLATVSVRDPAGELLAAAEGRVVGLHFPDTLSRDVNPRETPGVLSFLGLGDGLDVEVWATGYRAQVLTDVRGEVEVHLDAGTTIRAELESTPALEEGESLKLMLEFEDEYWRPIADVSIVSGGSAELIASHDGRHQFSLWLVISTPTSAGSSRIQSPEAAPAFEVVQGLDPGTQKVVLTEEALMAARTSWRRFR